MEDPSEGHIRFTHVGPYSVRLEWGSPTVDETEQKMFRIRWKAERVTYNNTTYTNHFEMLNLSPGTTYSIKVVANEDNKCFSGSVSTAIPGPKNFDYVSEDPTAVSLSWTPPPKILNREYRFQVILYRNEQETQSVEVESDVSNFSFGHLLPATEYNATICTILDVDKQSEPTVLFILTKPFPPDNLQIKSGATSVCLKWTRPITDGRINHKFQVIYSNEANATESIITEETEANILSLQPGAEYSFSVYTVIESNGKRLESTAVTITQRTNINMESVLMELGLQTYLRDKLTLKTVLEIIKPSDEDQTPSITSLPWLFLRKLMMANSLARTLKCASEESTDFNEDQKGINPLDLITALFHCADPFLQQEMALKMSLCQFSVPLLLPNCDTKECTLMLWALRDITKENCIVQTDLPLISFVRLGKNPNISKSELLNKLLSTSQQNHDAFVHRKMDNGNLQKKICNGLVEITWYLPSGKKKNDIFKDPVALANLRGDISAFEAQFAFLTQTSSAVFLFCDDLDSNQKFLNSLQHKPKLVLVCTNDGPTSKENLKQSLAQIKLKTFSTIHKDGKMNDSEFVAKIKKTVVGILADSTKVSIEKMSEIAPELGIIIDENNTSCQKAKVRTDQIIKDIGNIPEYKTKELPLQGKPWKEISKLEKEMCRLKNARKQNIEHYKSELKSQIQNLRMEQGSHRMSDTIYQFISGLCCSSNEQQYFLKWMKVTLDSLTRKHLSSLKEQYMEACKTTKEDKEHLKELDNQIVSSSLGVQHFMRELSQLYESAHSQETWKNSALKNLPELCAQLMLNGFPLELVDGDVSNIPLTWIGDVLTALNKLTAPHNKIRVVTVLGVQSTGKSTLLNTMFGVQFAVSSGRCTRGAFMLLLGVSEEFRAELQCDYLLVIDTEGLKSPELAEKAESYEHDNELATLVVGLSDITIVNISMENAIEMKDILQIVVHAFLRMKEVGKKPCCHFVHQNATEVAVRERNILLQKLDDMTQAAAKMEKRGPNKKFSDILEYSVDGSNWCIPGLWLGTPPMAPVSAGYSEEVSNLKEGILDILKAAKVPAQDFMAFAEWIRSLWKAVQFENFIFSFRNTLVVEAYSKLCAEFNTWEWTFKKHMTDWCTKSEIKITNMGAVSVQSVKALNIDGVLADLKYEATDELNKEEKILFGKIEEYFQNEEEHVHLVENHKEDFLNSARGLRRETEMYLKNKLENAVLIQKGIEKVELIKQKLRDTMKEKVLNLIRAFRDRRHSLSDGDLDAEFKKMWDGTVRQHSFIALPRQDVVKETYRLLHSNLEMKSGAVREMLLNVTSLDKCGIGRFFVQSETENIIQTFPYSPSPEQKENRSSLIQRECERISNNCEIFISSKTSAKSDYNSADIQELLCLIDNNLESCKDFQISPENEAALKIHICGNAARAFQRMHDDYIHRNDPLKCLERFREQWLADFKDLYYERDQCQKKAEMCAMQCFAPAVMEYIQKRLGPDIVDEMLTGERAVDFSTRSFFQFSLLKQLLQDDDFNNIYEYVENYEKFVTGWISEKIIEHFSKDDTFLKLEKKHLFVISKKLMEAVIAQRETYIRRSSNVQGRSIYIFVAKVFACLNKELVIPADTLNANLVINNSDPAVFADCLLSSIYKMPKSLAEQLDRESDVRDNLSRLSLYRPQEVLFSRVFGCGKRCPFCRVPCEAGGKEHAEHFASAHRPQGIGNFRWISTGKLIPDICSSLVASDKEFRCEFTGNKWHKYKEYRQIFPDWRIQPDPSIEATDFWKFIFAKYNAKFAERYKVVPADLPDDWHRISVQQANKCLRDTFKYLDTVTKR
ncbi:interferon-induced very large GTPase 1 [Danio rerio]|uniref:Interferon-induced very large GTPase 1 n=1 Tax=Danio rerio TaxID=7955 RepID=I3IS45_DANRE|nr:interferon-induced very large GTPase 1 [Danio rerio]|eukprot:XP_009292340.1 interferon-induced very large GTPase 1 [Danio rerio]